MIGTEDRITIHITPSTFRNTITWVIFIDVPKTRYQQEEKNLPVFYMLCPDSGFNTNWTFSD